MLIFKAHVKVQSNLFILGDINLQNNFNKDAIQLSMEFTWLLTIKNVLLQFTVKINFKNGGNILIGILEYGEKIPEGSFFQP